MKTLVFLMLILSCTAGFSQRQVDVDKNDVRITYDAFDILHGNRQSTVQYVRLVSGSPYFNEEWMKATVYITDSTVAKNALVKLNLLEGSFSFLNKKNEELFTDKPVVQITLTDTVTKANFTFIHFSRIPRPPNKTWYQVLAGKEFTLFKEYYKRMLESKPYASSVTEQEIKTTQNYYIGFNDEMTKVKKFSDIVALAGSKGNQLQEYINSHNLNIKKEDDLISLVNYYHTLN